MTVDYIDIVMNKTLNEHISTIKRDFYRKYEMIVSSYWSKYHKKNRFIIMIVNCIGNVMKKKNEWWQIDNKVWFVSKILYKWSLHRNGQTIDQQYKTESNFYCFDLNQRSAHMYEYMCDEWFFMSINWRLLSKIGAFTMTR